MRPLPNTVVVSNLRCVPLLALLCCLFAAPSARAQTTLNAGDIAFTYGNDGSGLSFVLLVDVDSGTEISFDSNSGLGGVTRTWTASGAQTAGTVFTESWGDFKKEGCYAYQGSANCSNVIAEFSLKGWESSGTYTSCSPSGGQSIEFPDVTSRTYSGTRSGSKSDLLAALGNTSNWSSGSNNTSSFTVSTGGGGGGSVGSDLLLSENFDDDGAFTFGNGSYFFSDGNNDYIGIYDPSGSTDDFGSGSQPSGIPSYTGNTGNYLVARDVDNGGVNPTELIWTVNTSGYESSAEVSIDLGNEGMDNGDDLRVYFSTDGTNYTEAFNFTGSAYWGPNDLSIQTYTANVTIPTAETVYVKLSLSGATASGDRVAIDEFKIFGTVNCTPVAVTASDITIQLSGAPGGVTVNATDLTASSTGDCFTVSSYEVSKAEGGTYTSSVTYDCTETGAQTLYVRATDGSNVSDATSVTVTVQDATAPSVPSVSVSDIEIGAGGTATITASSYASGSTDNCSSQGLTYLVSTEGASGFATTLDLDCSDLGAMTLYFRAQDASGNQSTSTLAADGAFTVVDNLAPTITAVSPTAVELTAGAATLDVSSLTFTASDNCTDSGSLTYTVSASSGGSFGSSVDLDCTDIPTTTLYFKATDASGNASAEFSQAFTVGETNAPAISSTSGAAVNLDGAGSVTVTASSTYVTATDDCSPEGDFTYLVSDATDGTYAGTIDLSCSDVGSKTLYFKVQDAAGNLSSASSASFTVNDVDNPSVTASDISVGLPGSSVTVNATDVVSSSSDNCSVSSTEIKLTSAVDGTYASSLDFSAFGDYGVTVRVSDASGNTATATATVTVTGELYSEDFEDESTNGDLCSPAYTPSDNNWTPLCPGGTSSISTLSAGDEAFRIQGNTGSSLEDTWQSATFSVAGLSNVLLTFDARSDGGLENSGESLDQFDVYAVKDDSETLLFGVDGHLDGTGGTKTVDDSFSQAIDLSSVSELSILIKARISASSEAYFFDDFRVCADDNDNGVCDEDDCESVVVTASAATVSLGTDGQVAVDGTTVSAGFAGDCFTPTSYEVSTDGTTYAGSVSYSCSDLGGNTLYVRGTDGNSTTDAITVTVTVQDYGGPFAAFGNDIDVVLAADGTYTLDADDLAAIDNGSYGTCSATLSVSPNSFTCGNLGANEAVLTISDGTISATANITITVKDETAPNVTVLSSADVTLDANGVATLLPSDVSTLGGAADACTDNSNIVWQIKRSGDANFSAQVLVGCSDVGFIQVQVQATDEEGNAFTSGDINVSVQDDIAPVLSGVTVMGAETLDSNEEAVLTASDFVDAATDNCGVTVYEISDSETTGFASTYTADCDDIQSGGKTFYFRVRDASQNSSNVVSATIVITEDENPVAVANAITLNVASEGQSVSLSADNASFNGSSDNCSFTSLVKIVGSGADYASSVTFTATGTYSVSLQVTDPAGNSATSTAVVTVAILAVDGCIDPTACNYDASANTDDGTCHYPGQECQSPSAGQGFVYTVNAGLTGCDCLPQDFEVVYFEDFGPGGASGGQGGGYGYEGYTDFNGNGTQDEHTASAETEWTLSSDFASIGNGTIDGAEASYWATIRVSDNATPPNDTDTIFDGLWLDNAYQWTTRIIDASAHDYIRIQAELTEDGALESDDYIRVRLVEDGTESASVLAEIVDDSATPFPAFETVDVTQANTADDVQVRVEAFNNASGEYHSFDDVVVSLWGKEGCTDAAADNYDASAQVDDLSCSYSFTTAYSLYDGGFGDPLWRGTECGGDCGAGPFFDAKPIAALAQTSQTTFNYVISSGTKVTVDGTLAADDGAAVQDLFVRNLTIESGGELVIPSGKRLRVVGDFLDLDGNGITGGGEFCIDDSGRFLFCTAEVNGGNACPTEVTIPNLAIASGGALDIPVEAMVKLTGSLSFGADDPLDMKGLIVMSGTSQQAISGHGATLDRLQISNTAGVTVSDSLEIQGRLTLDANTELDMGSNTLVFASNPSTGTGEEEKTAVLDMIPATASLTGAASGGRLAQNTNAEAKVAVERYIAADTDGVTYSGYTLFSSPIDGALVGDLDGIDGFYLAGWSDTDYPGSFATVLFWDEANSAFVEPTSNSQSLSAYGGAWIAIAGSQTPTMVTSGALNSHVENSSKTFSLTRTGSTEEFEGWNLVYNPYQARLDWDAIISNVVNAALIEDQYAVYDTQAKQFVRYSETNTELASAARCIEPGQSFWVRVKDGQTGGSLTIKPSMINNDGPGAEFIRSEQEGQVAVILETENVFGVTRSVLRFGEQGDAGAFVEGDLSRLGSSSIRVGELAFVAEQQNYIVKTVPMQVEGDLFVRSRANYPTILRVVEVTGDPAFCAHITDHETGEVMLLQEGMDMTFTLPGHEAEEGRFTLHGRPFAVALGQAPECEDSEAGAVIVELGEVVADLTVVDYVSFESVALLPQATGTVEVPVVPGEYAVHVDATEETSLCRGGRRQVVVFPGEQPELLGLEALPAECNVGEAELAFELYGGGEFQTSLWQGGAPVWQESLQPGEHEIGGFAPGEYVLKVDHTCLEAVEFVSLSDPGMPSVSALYDAFVEVESSGGAWLEAQCVGCLEGDGFGYYWILDGDIVAEDEPLSTRVYSVGSYDLQLVAFGPDCEMAVPFEVLVGKHKIGSPDAVRWLGMVEDHLMAVFDEEWSGVQCRWYDASGRLLDAQEGATLVGEAFLPVPDASGWLTLEVRSADGRLARWSGIR